MPTTKLLGYEAPNCPMPEGFISSAAPRQPLALGVGSSRSYPQGLLGWDRPKLCYLLLRLSFRYLAGGTVGEGLFWLNYCSTDGGAEAQQHLELYWLD